METKRKPKWLNKKLDYESMKEMGSMLRSLNLHTVCEDAKCPNMGECFRNRTATFMILGEICTRNCRFCAIPGGKPTPVDPEEQKHLAEAALKLNLSHVVITSVTRDYLPDGGATQFAECIKEIRKVLTNSSIEVLIPDFKGDKKALDIVIKAKPEIINHNVETVPSLYKIARPMANYKQSLEVLNYVKSQDPDIYTKSGIMLGLGEKENEVLQLFDDLIEYNCDMLTIGQYLPPSHDHASLKEYVAPEVFENYKTTGLEKGFKYVASGPYVRSSYNALEGIKEVKSK
ncbi:MAG: lipoyl synthase [Marinilabiliales bacterium]|nr:MAG: lipoyl synthase [Marinilabiliales bacterium]